MSGSSVWRTSGVWCQTATKRRVFSTVRMNLRSGVRTVRTHGSQGELSDGWAGSMAEYRPIWSSRYFWGKVSSMWRIPQLSLVSFLSNCNQYEVPPRHDPEGRHEGKMPGLCVTAGGLWRTQNPAVAGPASGRVSAHVELTILLKTSTPYGVDTSVWHSGPGPRGLSTRGVLAAHNEAVFLSIPQNLSR